MTTDTRNYVISVTSIVLTILAWFLPELMLWVKITVLIATAAVLVTVWFVKPGKDAEILQNAVKMYELAGQKLTYDCSTDMVLCGDFNFEPDRVPFISNDRDYKELRTRLLYADGDEAKQKIARMIEARIKYLFQIGDRMKPSSGSGHTSKQWKKAVDAFNKGDIEEAMRLMDEAIEAESAEYGKRLEKTKSVASALFDHLMSRAGVLESGGGLSRESLLKKRLECYERAIGICERGFIDDAKYAEVLFKSGNASFELKRFEDASEKYGKSLKMYRELAFSNPSAYTEYVAATLGNFAVLHRDTGKFADAEKEFEESLGTYRELAASNPSAYAAEVARVLVNFAALHSDTEKFEEAEKEYAEALSIRRELAASNPSAYAADVARVLNNFANLHIMTGRLEDAEKKTGEAIEICDSNMALIPSIYSSIKERSIQLQSEIKVKRNQQALNDLWASGHKGNA